MHKKKRFMVAIFPMIFEEKIQDHWERFLEEALRLEERLIDPDIMNGAKHFKDWFISCLELPDNFTGTP